MQDARNSLNSPEVMMIKELFNLSFACVISKLPYDAAFIMQKNTKKTT